MLQGVAIAKVEQATYLWHLIVGSDAKDEPIQLEKFTCSGRKVKKNRGWRMFAL